MSLDLSIVIPVFCADNALEKLHQSICYTFDGKYNYEVIYVDDRSTDDSWEVLKKIRAANKHVTIIRLSKNFGQHAATMCGFKHAKGELVITIDDDLEVHPSQAEKLLAEQKQTGAAIIYGEYEKLNAAPFRSFMTGVYKRLSKIESHQKGKGSSFRLLKKSLVKKLCESERHFIFIDELVLWYTANPAFIKVEANKDFIKKDRYKIVSLFSMAGNVIMFSSTFPLRLVTRIGFLLFLVNFLIGIYFLFKKIFLKIDVEGYASLIISILFSTGLIIFCIGILAQYLAQAIKSLNHKPAYSEDEILC